MNAVDLITRCRALGIGLAAGSDGALLWESDSDPPADLLENLTASKTAVLDLIREPAPFWDAAEAERLLSELRAEVACIKSAFGVQLPASLASLLTDAVVIGERYIREYMREMARGWDPIELLRDMVPHVRNCVENWRKMQIGKPATRSGFGEERVKTAPRFRLC